MFTNLILILTGVSIAMAGIDSLVNRVIAKRKARDWDTPPMLCADPRAAKHMLTLYAASEREWENSSEMRAIRRKAAELNIIAPR